MSDPGFERLFQRMADRSKPRKAKDVPTPPKRKVRVKLCDHTEHVLGCNECRLAYQRDYYRKHVK